jgi:Protein of unknown function (DUF2439)
MQTDEFFEALYTAMLYRKKKVKKFQEGFVKRVAQKLVLYDERKVKIESMFSSSKLEDGLELEFEENYCEVMGKENLLAAKASTGTPVYTKPPVKRMGLSRSSGLKVTIRKNDLMLPPREELADTVISQPAKLATTRRLKLGDVDESVPKTNQELLDIFSEETSNVIQEAAVSSKIKSFTSIVPRFHDFDGSASDEDDYEKPSSSSFIKNYTPTQSPILPAIPLAKPVTQSRFTPVGKNSVLNPSKSFKPVKRVRVSLRPNKFNFCFQPPSNDQGTRLIREMSIPDTFSSVEEYKSCLTGCLTEAINLDLMSLRAKYEKILQRSKSNLDSVMRSQRIPFYSGVCLSESQSLDFENNRSNTVTLAIDHKEHHSQYSKDDIWLLSDSPYMVDCEFFRSFYYGPSGSNLEVIIT